MESSNPSQPTKVVTRTKTLTLVIPSTTQQATVNLWQVITHKDKMKLKCKICRPSAMDSRIQILMMVIRKTPKMTKSLTSNYSNNSSNKIKLMPIKMSITYKSIKKTMNKIEHLQ